jgi:glycogen(starch) synthase
LPIGTTGAVGEATVGSRLLDTLTVVTPWFPQSSNPFGGAFVLSAVDAVRDAFDRVEVVHLEAWPPATTSRRVQERCWRDLIHLGPHRCDAVRGSGDVDVRYVPVPLPGSLPWARRADYFWRGTQATLRLEHCRKRIWHAHVGVPGGIVAMRLAADHEPLFVTEHATYLDQILAQADSRELYRQVLARCQAFFCVSELLREQVIAEFPDMADKVHVVANPIPFERVVARPTPISPRRWLFVGGLREHKGVRQILEAFVQCRTEDPALRLTFLGGGPLRDALVKRAAALGVADAVEFRSAVAPEAVFETLREHDLLVHNSRYETFGMTTLEAIAAGIPVLVTRCGGPEETLHGLERYAGVLIPVAEDPKAIVDGYQELRARFDQLDISHARKELTRRYGLTVVRQALLEHYRSLNRGAPAQCTSCS